MLQLHIIIYMHQQAFSAVKNKNMTHFIVPLHQTGMCVNSKTKTEFCTYVRTHAYAHADTHARADTLSYKASVCLLSGDWGCVGDVCDSQHNVAVR